MATNPVPLAKQNPVTGRATPRVRSFIKDDFPFIRKASIELAICFAISAVLIGASEFLLANQKAKQSQQQSTRNEAQNKLSEAETEKREVQDFQPKYEQLVMRGFVGEEKRLDWVDAMKQSQEKHKLLAISYEIFPQLPVQMENPAQTGQLELRSSKMSISMNLLHEMDLFNFMQDLKSKGFYSPQSCIIKSTEATEVLTPHLTAECKLAWLTLGPRPIAGDAAAPAPAQ